MKKRIAIVTGASSGIGKAIYEVLKEDERWKVYGMSRRGPDIKIDLSSKSLFFWHLDLEPIDLLINCAGIMKLKEEGEEQNIMNVNFWGAVNVMKQVKYNKNACVINIASISASNPDEDMPIYAASKAALIAASKAYAKKWAKLPVRVNCISPGFYETNLVEGETPQHLIDEIPMQYEDKPKNLVSIVKAIYDTPYMTGSNVVIDGGLTI